MCKKVFEGKVAVVTGAGGVLCSAFAEALASSGAKVALLDLNEEAAKQAAEAICAAGGTAKGYKANVLDKACLEAVHAEVLKDFGKCDILINGAGGNSPRCTTAHEYYEQGDELTNEFKTFFNLDKADFDFVFGLNIMGTLLPTQVFAPDMLNNDGTIVNISSMNAFTPLTKIPAYSAAKAGRSNFNEDGTPTPRTGKILAATPMGRFGKPEELLGTLIWLCDSSVSGFVTGVVVPVDGGFSAYSGV